MEWNTKSSSLWDWENLFEFDAKTTENPKKLLVTDCSIADDQFVGSGSFDSPKNGGCSTEGSGSDTGHASSKSSKSASMYSSSIEESRATNIAIESSEGFLQECNGKKKLVKVETSGSSTIPDVLAGSGEPLLGLKLGKRTYFEDIGAGQNSKSSYRSVVTKMCKSTSQTALIPRCQVEGCNLDLSSAKDYHRKHRICESHTKSPRIIVAGEELRFCQQCSRFHGLSEFDDKKRSCRKRLSDHNARRRKPQPEALRLNPTRLSSLYDERQHINFIFDQAPTLDTRHAANLTWSGTESSYLGHTREYISKPSKAGLAPGHLYSPNDKMSGSCIVSHHNSSRISPPKGTSSEVLKPGLGEPVMSTSLNAKQDPNGALSLLSTSSWVSCETKPTGQTKVSQLAMTQDLPLTSNYWQPQQMHVDNPVQIYVAQNDECSHFQDLNFLKTPYESGLNFGQFN